MLFYIIPLSLLDHLIRTAEQLASENNGSMSGFIFISQNKHDFRGDSEPKSLYRNCQCSYSLRKMVEILIRELYQVKLVLLYIIAKTLN